MNDFIGWSYHLIVPGNYVRPHFFFILIRTVTIPNNVFVIEMLISCEIRGQLPITSLAGFQRIDKLFLFGNFIKVDLIGRQTTAEFPLGIGVQISDTNL